MKFMLIHTLEESALAHGDQGSAQAQLDDWVAEMIARGIALDGSRLHPVASATSVRRRDGQTLVVDGPFAETKEQVAGYDLIECRDLDEAIAVAAAHPTTSVGSIEVRPLEDGAPTVDLPDRHPGAQRYLLLICAAMGAAHADRDPGPEVETTPEDSGEEDVDRWVDDLDSRGVRLFGWPLQHPSTAVTVRHQDGRTITLDGPFAETKEQIAGYDLLECTDLDEAVAAAASHPVATVGVVEVRPLWVA